MQLRKFHFVVGLAGAAAFVVTGAYMRAGLVVIGPLLALTAPVVLCFAFFFEAPVPTPERVLNAGRRDRGDRRYGIARARRYAAMNRFAGG
jgi:hypothetical protein